MDPLSQLMQRYCFGYTAAHDFTVADQIIDDRYTFCMGEHIFTGREELYKPAAERQFKAYPGLGLTVHDFLSNGKRCAMFFSEHGRSIQYGALATWHGLCLYRWNGERLTECRVEQDYYGRRRQLVGGRPDPVDAPAHSPWTIPVEEPDVQAEAVAARWLEKGGFLHSEIGSLDDERVAPQPARVRFVDEAVSVVDIMSAGSRVAFHVKITGAYAGGLPALDGHEGAPATLYANGILDTQGSTIGRLRAVTDRYTMERRILAAAKV